MDLLILKSLVNYEEYSAANDDKKVSLFDYLHGYFANEQLKPDLSIAFLKLIWPDFVCMDGLVFLKEEYSERRHGENVLQGISGRDLEYWMNLLTIDGLFETLTFEQSQYFGYQLVEAWTKKLEMDFPDKKFVVECVIEDEDGEEEVYVVFYQGMK